MVKFDNPFSHRTDGNENSINEINYDITGDTSCIELELNAYQSVEKFYNYEIL